MYIAGAVVVCIRTRIACRFAIKLSGYEEAGLAWHGCA